MTTKPSSLQHATLIDSLGQAVTLGDQIGKGGEGAVFEVAGRSDVVAKVYHTRVLNDEIASKLDAMMAWQVQEPRRDRRLARVDPLRPERAAGARLLDAAHQGRAPAARALRQRRAGGPTSPRPDGTTCCWPPGTSRRPSTPSTRRASWSGTSTRGTCLSTTRCACGLSIAIPSRWSPTAGPSIAPWVPPHFTPTELQSVKLRDVTRTIDHDGFGLAVLIFHLVFVGRHPFAGRFRGPGDLTIERAIAERRFAFSARPAEHAGRSPPGVSQDHRRDADAGGALRGRLPRRGPGGSHVGPPRSRPTPVAWATELEVLMKNRASCSFDDSHVHYNRSSECPWCRIEDEGGPAFFLPDTGRSLITKDRISELDRRIKQLRVLDFPDLTSKRLEPPRQACPQSPEGHAPAIEDRLRRPGDDRGRGGLPRRGRLPLGANGGPRPLPRRRGVHAADPSGQRQPRAGEEDRRTDRDLHPTHAEDGLDHPVEPPQTGQRVRGTHRAAPGHHEDVPRRRRAAGGGPQAAPQAPTSPSTCGGTSYATTSRISRS